MNATPNISRAHALKLLRSGEWIKATTGHDNNGKWWLLIENKISNAGRWCPATEADMRKFPAA